MLLRPGEGLDAAGCIGCMAIGTVLIRYAARQRPRRRDGLAHAHRWTPSPVDRRVAERLGLRRPGRFWTGSAWVSPVFLEVLAYGLFFWFANREDLTTFSSLGFLTPVFALASGGWLLGERLDGLQWVGVLMVLVSVVFESAQTPVGAAAPPTVDSVSRQPLNLVLVSTPIGTLGSGRGGGVELTITSLMRGLLSRGHHLRLVGAAGSTLPQGCEAAELLTASGVDQPSWQHAPGNAPVLIPRDGLMPALLDKALRIAERADAVLNFGYDWLPLWVTPHVRAPLFHPISMGSVAEVMGDAVEALGHWDQRRLAFHTRRQAADFALPSPPRVVGNGFDLSRYELRLETDGPLGGQDEGGP